MTPVESAMQGVEMIDVSYRYSRFGKSEFVC